MAKPKDPEGTGAAIAPLSQNRDTHLWPQGEHVSYLSPNDGH